MLFWDTPDESAWGLALVGLIVVSAVIILGEVTGDVQPKAPVEITHPDVSSPYLHEKVTPEVSKPESPYPSPVPGKH